MSCHAIIKNLYEPKMDVVLTIRFKITAEIEITKVSCFQRKDSTPYIKYMDKQSEFLSFPTIYCGKTRVDNHLIIF